MPPPGATKKATDPGTPMSTDTETVLELAAGLDTELMELKAKYDQYFLGLERVEPIRERDDLKKRINALKTQSIRNTSAKFKIGSVFQKFLTYERLWLRAGREREEGTYKADQFKARLHAQNRDLAKKEKSAGGDDQEPKTDPNIQLAALQKQQKPEHDDFDIDEASDVSSPRKDAPPGAAKPPPPPASATIARPPPPPRTISGTHHSVASTGELGEDKLRAIYGAYLTAKKRCNEPTQGVTFESVSASLKKQVPQIMKQFNAKGVDFKVVIKDGKAVLKAVPKT